MVTWSKYKKWKHWWDSYLHIIENDGFSACGDFTYWAIHMYDVDEDSDHVQYVAK